METRKIYTDYVFLRVVYHLAAVICFQRWKKSRYSPTYKLSRCAKNCDAICVNTRHLSTGNRNARLTIRPHLGRGLCEGELLV